MHRDADRIDVLLADKSCDADAIREELVEAVIPAKAIHACFQVLPAVTFLFADAVYSAGPLTGIFGVDSSGIPQPLADRLAFQLNRLKLSERHPDAINIFLFGQTTAFRLFKGKQNERDLLRQFLLDSATTFDADLGLNHWHAAVFRGLAACDAFLDDPWTYFDKPPAAMKAAT